MPDETAALREAIAWARNSLRRVEIQVHLDLLADAALRSIALQAELTEAPHLLSEYIDREMEQQYAATIAKLRAENAALAADRERLDWLERNKRTLHCTSVDAEGDVNKDVPWCVVPNFNGEGWKECDTPREAIDAARNAERAATPQPLGGNRE